MEYVFQSDRLENNLLLMKVVESCAAINHSDVCVSKSSWSCSTVSLPNQMFYSSMKQICRDMPVSSVPFHVDTHSHINPSHSLCRVHLITQHRWCWCHVSSQYLLTVVHLEQRHRPQRKSPPGRDQITVSSLSSKPSLLRSHYNMVIIILLQWQSITPLFIRALLHIKVCSHLCNLLLLISASGVWLLVLA